MAHEECDLACWVIKYRNAAYADCTKSAYRCQLKSYLLFCDRFHFKPVPASSDVMCKYAAHLASKMKPNSVRQYMNIVKLLHIESGFKNPLEGDWFLSTVLRGIDRLNATTVHRKLPITPEILKKIHKVLDRTQSRECTFWAACLVAFYGMMRKASLFPRGKKTNHMLVGNCVLHSWGIVIKSTYSKTIQFREREVFVSLPCNNNDRVMCPVYALLRAMQQANCIAITDCLFKYRSEGRDLIMTYSLFTSMLKGVLETLKLSVSDYSGHSFRRGGASHALKCGIPAEIIKAQGDWKTLSYLDYTDSTNYQERAAFMHNMF